MDISGTVRTRPSPLPGPAVPAPATAASDLAASDLAGPDLAGPDLAASDLAGPDTSRPDASGPDASGPATTGPDTAGDPGSGSDWGATDRVPLTSSVPLPIGVLDFALYPTALLRTAGFDVRPLLTGTGADPDTGTDHGSDPERTLLRLRDAFTDPRLEEAVAQSNPSFHRFAFAPGRAMTTSVPYRELTKRGRREVRTAHRYLRRMLGKTETNAFFGPTLVVRWDPRTAEPVLVDPPGPERCVVGLSAWLVHELARAARQALPPGRRGWRRDPLWASDGEALHRGAGGGRVTLTADAARVWSALPATPEDLRVRTELAADRVVAALKLLAPALRPSPEPPATLVDGLGWLLQHRDGPVPAPEPDHPVDQPAPVSGVPGDGVPGDGVPGDGVPGEDRLDRLAALVRRAETAGWPESVQVRERIRAEAARTGLHTARAAGQHYADRDVVNEDRSSPWSDRVRLGRPALESAHQALAVLLPVLLLNALLRQADARQAVAAVTGGGTAGLVGLAARDIAPVTERADLLYAALSRLVPAEPGLTEVRLAVNDLAAAVAPLWELPRPRPGDQPAALPGLDLMVSGGPPGTGRWVLSECHDDSSSALGGITSRVQPGQGRQYRDFCAQLPHWVDTTRMATVVGRRRSRHITPELPGLSIELSGVSGKPPGEVVAAADVQVAADAAAVLHAGRRYQLYPGDVPGPLFLALSLPCLVPVPFATDRPYTPRIVLEDVVVQRRRWALDLPEGGRRPAGERFALPAWVGEHDLPQRFFLRHPDEPKPLLVDVADALCRDELARLRPAPVVCTEALPDLEDTWWAAGGPQLAELRAPVLLRWEVGDRARIDG